MVTSGRRKYDFQVPWTMQHLNHPNFLLSSVGICACMKATLERHSWPEEWQWRIQARTTLWEVFAINLELWGAPREPSTGLSLELYNITTSLWEQDVFIIALFSHRLALEVIPLILHVKSTHYPWLASEMCFPIWKYWFLSFPFGPPL